MHAECQNEQCQLYGVAIESDQLENCPVCQQELVVVMTGASAGIGKATTELLAQAGANVVVTARREDRLHQLVADLAHFPGRRLPLAGNIQEESFARELGESTTAEFGRLDVLVNNAGLGHRSQLAEMSPADMRTILDTNVMGVLYTTWAAVPQMKKQGGGQIINISSIVGQRPLPGSGLYCASKTAVNFISRSLRMELRPHNITVTLVYPGRTLTEFGEAKLGQKGSNPSVIGRTSAQRVGQAIVKSIRNGRTEVYITWYDWLFTHLNRLFPRTIDHLVGWGATRMV